MMVLCSSRVGSNFKCGYILFMKSVMVLILVLVLVKNNENIVYVASVINNFLCF
jgi:hypothetical protein